jgi:hypothetical protein
VLACICVKTRNCEFKKYLSFFFNNAGYWTQSLVHASHMTATELHPQTYLIIFFMVLGDWTQGLILARQVLYCLSHTSSTYLTIE